MDNTWWFCLLFLVINVACNSQNLNQQDTSLKSTVPRPTVEVTYTYDCGEVVDISLVSEGMGWALVNCSRATSNRNLTTAEVYRLVNGNWQHVPDAPNLSGYACYQAISAISPKEFWAVGLTNGIYVCGQGNWLLHYLNGKWERVNLDREMFGNHSTGLLEVEMLDAKNGWIGGYGLIFRLKDNTWSVDLDIPPPPDSPRGFKNGVHTISMANVQNGWAVGGRLLYHYHNEKWIQWVDPLLNDIKITDIHTIEINEAWAVGIQEVGTCQGYEIYNSFILHYVDGSWYKIVPPQNEFILTSIKMVGADEGWAVGHKLDICESSTFDRKGVVLHYSDGEWQVVSTPEDKYARVVDTVMEKKIWVGGQAFSQYSMSSDQWYYKGIEPVEHVQVFK